MSYYKRTSLPSIFPLCLQCRGGSTFPLHVQYLSCMLSFCFLSSFVAHCLNSKFNVTLCMLHDAELVCERGYPSLLLHYAGSVKKEWEKALPVLGRKTCSGQPAWHYAVSSVISWLQFEGVHTEVDLHSISCCITDYQLTVIFGRDIVRSTCMELLTVT